MSVSITDPWTGDSGFYANQIDVSERLTHSKLLDKNGNPMKYEQRKVGFDLRPKGKKNE